MHSQVSAERQKRAFILESEGSRQSAINVAEGSKQATILASEADRLEKINRATGEAEGVLVKAKATATSITMIADAIKTSGEPAVAMMIAEKWVEAFGKLAKESNTMLLPSSVSDPASMVAQALSIYKQIGTKALPGK